MIRYLLARRSPARFAVVASETVEAPVTVHIAKHRGAGGLGRRLDVVVEDPWGAAHRVELLDDWLMGGETRWRSIRLGTVDTFYPLSAETEWTADPATRKVTVTEGRGLYFASFEVNGPRAEWSVILPDRSINGVVDWEGLIP